MRALLQRRGLTRALLLSLAVALVPVRLAHSVPAGELEYRVKAAFLFNFTKFVEWPASAFANANAPLTICVLGADPFGPVLDETIKGKQVDNRNIAVRRITEIQEARDCRILFISDSERSRLRDITQAIRAQPVLTVGEAPEFTDARGMIRFLIVDGRVRFIVNRGATTQAQLALSSKLLSVAQDVVDGP